MMLHLPKKNSPLRAICISKYVKFLCNFNIHPMSLKAVEICELLICELFGPSLGNTNENNLTLWSLPGANTNELFFITFVLVSMIPNSTLVLNSLDLSSPQEILPSSSEMRYCPRDQEDPPRETYLHC